MKKMIIAAAAASLFATAAYAAASYDVVSNTGFVGKGDVQLAYGWNNKQLNDNAGGVTFKAVVATDHTWDCTNSAGTRLSERSRTTKQQELLSAAARDNKRQITGFNISGVSSSRPIGQQTIGTCGGNTPNFVVGSLESGEEELESLSVNHNGVEVFLTVE